MLSSIPMVLYKVLRLSFKLFYSKDFVAGQSTHGLLCVLAQIMCKGTTTKAQANIISVNGLQSTQATQSDIASIAVEQDPVLKLVSASNSASDFSAISCTQ